MKNDEVEKGIGKEMYTHTHTLLYEMYLKEFIHTTVQLEGPGMS